MASKTALLDVNILIALFDIHHLHHELASTWFIDWLEQGNQWATCPITQNGCLRILSLPNYQNGFKPIDIKHHLDNAVANSSHLFIADNISLLQDELINWHAIQGAKQLTDTYLLALAKYNGAVFVSLDNRIDKQTVMGFNERDFVSLMA